LLSLVLAPGLEQTQVLNHRSDQGRLAGGISSQGRAGRFPGPRAWRASSQYLDCY